MKLPVRGNVKGFHVFDREAPTYYSKGDVIRTNCKLEWDFQSGPQEKIKKCHKGTWRQQPPRPSNCGVLLMEPSLFSLATR